MPRSFPFPSLSHQISSNLFLSPFRLSTLTLKSTSGDDVPSCDSATSSSGPACRYSHFLPCCLSLAVPTYLSLSLFIELNVISKHPYRSSPSLSTISLVYLMLSLHLSVLYRNVKMQFYKFREVLCEERGSAPPPGIGRTRRHPITSSNLDESILARLMKFFQAKPLRFVVLWRFEKSITSRRFTNERKCVMTSPGLRSRKANRRERKRDIVCETSRRGEGENRATRRIPQPFQRRVVRLFITESTSISSPGSRR